MPADLKPWRTCRRPKREGMSAPRELSAGPIRSDSMRTPQASRKKAKIPKPVNVTHAECERALQTWTKRQRTESLSDKKHLPKSVNQACE